MVAREDLSGTDQSMQSSCKIRRHFAGDFSLDQTSDVRLNSVGLQTRIDKRRALKERADAGRPARLSGKVSPSNISESKNEADLE
jgi:hypothetical protein